LPSAAEQQPGGKLARYKGFLKVETHRLKLQHRAGAGGREICRARAAILDALLRHLWETAKSSLSAQAQKEFPPLALVAIGGYGRAELNPHSDIDFMFLHDGQVAANKPLPHLSKLIDGVLYPLWDIGLKVGHSVRSMDDCVKVANTDMQSKTSLIEARLIAGDEALFKKFQKTLVAKCVDGYEEKYIAHAAGRPGGAARQVRQLGLHAGAEHQERLRRPARFPKPAVDGVFQISHALAEGTAGARIRRAAERKQLEAAYDFLLRVRTELHYHVNRPLDVLGKNLQPAVALGLGYGDRSPSKRIEKFMRDLYTHMRNIFLITRTLEQRMALLPPPRTGCRLSLRAWLPKRTRPVEPVDGFLFVDGEIRAASNRVFRDQPRRLMRVFLHAQQRGICNCIPTSRSSSATSFRWWTAIF
jgi:[protein-PII] uridylyltransferase